MKWIIWRYFSFFFCLSSFFLSIIVYLLFSLSSVTSVSANNRRTSLRGSTNSRWNAQAEPASPVRLPVRYLTNRHARSLIFLSRHLTRWRSPIEGWSMKVEYYVSLTGRKNLKRRQTTFSEQTLLFLWHFIFPFPSRFSPFACVFYIHILQECHAV